MKVYIVHWLSSEGGVLEPFTSKAAAMKRHRQLERLGERHDRGRCECTGAYDDEFQSCEGSPVAMVYGGTEEPVEFEISAAGILDAISYASEIVSK